MVFRVRVKYGVRVEWYLGFRVKYGVRVEWYLGLELSIG